MIKTVKDVNIKNKKVLFRVAYDITLEKKGKNWMVSDATRIEVTLPTLKYLLKNNCSVIILTWLGRPGGKYNEKYSLKPIAKKLSQLIKSSVKIVSSCDGKKVEKIIKELKPREILMLENVRFCKREEDKQMSFGRKLVQGSEIIVFDAFAQAHRDVPSVTGILKYKPAVAGFIIENEIKNLDKIVKNPKKPYLVIVGGAKINDKLEYVEQYLQKASKVMLGGGLANLFLKIQGFDIGASKVDSKDKSIRHKQDGFNVQILAEKIYKKYKNKIVLPVDFIAASSVSANASVEIINIKKDKIRKNWKFLDIGPKTVKLFNQYIKQAKSIFWNGPLGVFEISKFSKGSREIAVAISKNMQAITIIGGGDTEIALSEFKINHKKFSHISTGGGASLEYVTGKELPAMKSLKQNQKKYDL